MSTYVMSDIHGCYDEFISMLSEIKFSNNDQLIIAGDHIDRGTKSFEMLKWIENCPPNVTLLHGNHEEKFSEYVEFMLMLDRDEKLCTDFSSNEDAKALYSSVQYFVRSNSLDFLEFDQYGTLSDLLERHNVAMTDLIKWADMFQKLSYYKKLDINGKTYVIVHAGYTENRVDTGKIFDSIEDFYLYAREEGLQFGIEHGTIIFGHTPTIAEEKFAFNDGRIFKYYNEKNDCTFYDIDCGCAFKSIRCDARLACIRLEDEKIFYI